MFLSVGMLARLCYFPDINHQTSNIDKGVFSACGLGHVDAKSMFLARFRHGPFSGSGGGHWQAQLREAHKAAKHCAHKPEQEPPSLNFGLLHGVKGQVVYSIREIPGVHNQVEGTPSKRDRLHQPFRGGSSQTWLAKRFLSSISGVEAASMGHHGRRS
jgi:hypothetical protein